MYRFQTLTGLLRGPSNEFKDFFTNRYPNTAAIRSDFTARSGTLQVDGGEAPAATTGTAFDVMMRLVLDYDHLPVEVEPSSMWRPEFQQTTDLMTAIAHRELTGADQTDDFYRAVWALAQLTECWRSIHAYVASPLAGLIYGLDEIPVDKVLALAPADGIRQLRELRALAEEKLLPHLEQPLYIGPRFWTDNFLKADADLISNGTLIDLKVMLGTLNKKQERIPTIPDLAVRQLLGYTLLDSHHDYKLHSVAIYSARYGDFITWPLDQYLNTLSVKPRHIFDERVDMEILLGI